MKKTLLLLALVIVAAQAASAQRVVINGQEHGQFSPRESYNNFSWSQQKLIEPITGQTLLESKWGAAFTKGRTYFLHRKGVADMLYFGLDATWFEVNYAQFENPLASLGLDQELIPNIKMHQADISIFGIGPSVNLFPVERLGVHAYARYNPTVSAVFSTGDEFAVMGGYASMMVAGGAVSWSVIALGVEARWGSGKYKAYEGFDGEDGEDGGMAAGKLKTSGMRAYLSLRF